MHSFRYRDGKLYCEGVSVAALAEKFGTPLYIYSRRTLSDHFTSLDAALAPIDHRICYAMKANSNLAVLRVLANLGAGFDIVSAGELRRVIAAGGNPRLCLFAGVGKQEDESNSPSAREFIASTLKAKPNSPASIASPPA